MEQRLNAVIFTSSSSPYAPLVLGPILEKYAGHIKAVVTLDQTTGGSRLRKIRSVVRVAGFRYAMLKLILFGSIRIRQMVGNYPTISTLCRVHGIRELVLPSLKRESTIHQLRDLKPGIVLSVLFEKIFPDEILQIPTMAALNFHPAPLPRYAGIAPTFWVLSNGEKETAVTIHHLDVGIDTGDIFAQSTVGIKEDDSVHALYVRCCLQGSRLLAEAFERLFRGECVRTSQNMDERSYFSSPTRKGYSSLCRHGHALWVLRDILFPLRSRE